MTDRLPHHRLDPKDFQKYQWLLIILATFGSLTGIFYMGIFISTRFWQALLIAGIMFAAATLAPLVYYMLKRGIITAPGALMLFAVSLGYGGNELVWKGLLPYHVVGGILLIGLTAYIVLPRRWISWIVAESVYLLYLFLVDHFEPISRINHTQISVLLPYAIGTNLILVLALLGLAVQFAFSHTLRVRAMVIIALLVTIPMIISGTVSAYINTRISQDNANARLEAAVVLKEAKIRDWLESLQLSLSRAVLPPQQSQYVKILSDGGPESTFTTARALLKDNFNQIISQTGLFDQIYLINRSGIVVFSTGLILEGADLSDEVYFTPGLRGFYITQPSLSTTDNRISMMTSMPVLDSNNNPVGLVAGHVNFAKLDEILLVDPGIGSSGETYLINWNGMLITPSRYNLPVGKIYALPTEMQAAMQNQQNGQASYRSYRVAYVLGAYRWIPELGVMVVAEQNSIEAYRSTFGAVALTIGVGVFALILAVVAAGYVSYQIAGPISKLAKTAEAVAAGNLKLKVEINAQQSDEISALGQAFNSMTTQLSAQMTKLEERVSERTAELERRSAQLHVAAEVARDASTTREYQLLLDRAVNLVRDRFMFYHAGIFLVDDLSEYAVLRSATGDAGRIMLEQGHKLKLGEVGMVGNVAATGLPRIALDVGEESTHYRNPLLPATRSEMALPLKIGSKVIGVLDVQSEARDAFTDEDVVIMQILADQLAVAIENARLFQELQDSLRQVEGLYGQYNQQSWQRIIETNRLAGYRYEPGGSIPIIEWDKDGNDSMSTQNTNPLAVEIPLRVRGQQIGSIEVLPNPDHWSDDNLIFLVEVSERVSQALESARLYQESQLRAASEQLVSNITARMRSTLDVDNVLQTAAREIRQALNLQEVEIRLGLDHLADLAS